MKGNVIQMNTLHLNSVRLNGIGKVQSVSLKGGSTEDPVFPPVEPPVEPEPTPTYTLSASVTNGKVSAKRNGSAVNLPYTANEGDVIVLEVTPNEGYEFKGWLDGNKSNPRTVTMTGNVVLSASCVEIAKPTYTLSASVTNGKVSAKRNGSAVNLPFTANEGDTIVLEVTPNEGYEFNGWADGVTDNPRTITMNADVALSAQCVEVVQPSKYIQFEDKAVEAICVANWSSDGIGLTEEDAAKVTTIGTTFKGNTEITSFEELQYFTSLRAIPQQAFLGCKALKSVSIPIGVETISGNYMKGAFQECSALSKVDIPNSVTEILTYAFYKCSELPTINLRNVQRIEHHAFDGCSKLAIDVNAPNLTGTISEAAFYKSGIVKVSNLGTITVTGGNWNSGPFASCLSLQTAIMPKTLSNVSKGLFYGDTSLTHCVFLSEVPPALVETQQFTNCSSLQGVYVPDASVEAYKTATNWKTHASRIKPISQLAADNPTLYAEIQQYL